MAKEKVVFFLDYANINRAARENRYRLDYHNLLQYIGEDRFLIDAHCYAPINPRNEHRLDREIEELWRSGYIVNTKVGSIAGGTYKCNFDVEITMDVLKVVYQAKPDIIVLASGDADFVPLIIAEKLFKKGISFDEEHADWMIANQYVLPLTQGRVSFSATDDGDEQTFFQFLNANFASAEH